MIKHQAARECFTEKQVIHSSVWVLWEQKPGQEPKPHYLGKMPNLGKELAVQIRHYPGSVLSLIKIILEHRHIIKTINLIKRLLPEAYCLGSNCVSQEEMWADSRGGQAGMEGGRGFHLNRFRSALLNTPTESVSVLRSGRCPSSVYTVNGKILKYNCHSILRCVTLTVQNSPS